MKESIVSDSGSVVEDAAVLDVPRPDIEVNDAESEVCEDEVGGGGGGGGEASEGNESGGGSISDNIGTCEGIACVVDEEEEDESECEGERVEISN